MHTISFNRVCKKLMPNLKIKHNIRYYIMICNTTVAIELIHLIKAAEFFHGNSINIKLDILATSGTARGYRAE